MLLLMIYMAAPLLSACGPTKQESWNSYYYGTVGQNNAYYEHRGYPQDNDDTYQIPWGTWKDDQMPQGQKW